MKTTSYAQQYGKLERQATGAEGKVEEYRQRVEDCRWQQCNLAHDAVDSGTFTQVAFAAAVGKSATTIKRQIAAWRAYGSHATLPSYGEAMAGAVGTTVSAENGRKRLSTAKAVLSDPDVLRQLLTDPQVRMVASQALRETPAERVPADRDGQRAPADDLVVTIGRYVKRINVERREGRLHARDVRAAARRVHAFADVLDRVATSRGLEDEDLETLVSLEVFGRMDGRRLVAPAQTDGRRSIAA